MKQNPNLKINVILYGKFKTLVEGKIDEAIKHFNTKNDIISKSTDLDAWHDEKVKDQLLVDAEEFQETNSGWSLIEIINLLVNI